MSIAPVQFNQGIYFKNNIQPGEPAKTAAIPQAGADTVEIAGQKKSLSNSQKWGIGIGIAAVATAIVLLLRGKPKAAQEEVVKLAEHIDFSPAKTTKEAVEFAKTHLGIKYYDENMPLEVMNWVNEGLVNVNNVTKGKAKIFDSIGYEPCGEDSLAEAIQAKDGGQFGSVFNINKTVIGNLDKYIDNLISINMRGGILSKDASGKYKLAEFYNSGETSEKLLANLNKFGEKPDSFSFSDKIKFSEDLTELGYANLAFFNAPMSKIEQLLKNKNAHAVLEKHSKLPDLKKLEGMTTKEQKDILLDITNTCIKDGIPLRLGFAKGDKFRIIYHELGHLQHEAAIGNDAFNAMGKPEECKEVLGKVSDITNDFINSKEKQQTANRVSSYAATSPLEFVAETYRKLVRNAVEGKGEKLPDDVMKLYSEYKGPAI